MKTFLVLSHLLKVSTLFALVLLLAAPAWGVNEKDLICVPQEALLFRAEVEPMNWQLIDWPQAQGTFSFDERCHVIYTGDGTTTIDCNTPPTPNCSTAHYRSLLQQLPDFVADPGPLREYLVEGNPIGEDSLREKAKDLIAQANKLKRQKAFTKEVQKTLTECPVPALPVLPAATD